VYGVELGATEAFEQENVAGHGTSGRIACLRLASAIWKSWLS
jgi:hypothetical protein